LTPIARFDIDDARRSAAWIQQIAVLPRACPQLGSEAWWADPPGNPMVPLRPGPRGSPGLRLPNCSRTHAPPKRQGYGFPAKKKQPLPAAVFVSGHRATNPAVSAKRGNQPQRKALAQKSPHPVAANDPYRDAPPVVTGQAAGAPAGSERAGRIGWGGGRQAGLTI